MLTGYNNNHKAYRLVDVNANLVSFSRDVVVDEEAQLYQIITNDIYRQFIQTTWVHPQGRLRPKMAFYDEHFLELREGLIF